MDNDENEELLQLEPGREMAAPEGTRQTSWSVPASWSPDSNAVLRKTPTQRPSWSVPASWSPDSDAVLRKTLTQRRKDPAGKARPTHQMENTSSLASQQVPGSRQQLLPKGMQQDRRGQPMCSLGETETDPGFSRCFTRPFKKKTTLKAVIPVILHIILFAIWWSVLNKPAAGKSPTSSVFLLYTISCPKSWVGYEGRCYYFSSAEGTWDFSQRNCSSYGASLAAIDTQQEMDFVMRYKISADHWFGLRRAGEGQPWKWTNGSIFNNWFNIRAKGFCTYLNDEGAFSTRCDTLRNWICRKSLHSFHCKDVLRLPTNTSLLDSGYQLMKINCSMPEG